jgi:hypothetical protein
MNSYIQNNVPVPNPEIFSDPNPNYKFLHTLAQREGPDMGDRYVGEHMNDNISQDINMMDNHMYNEHSQMVGNADRLLNDSTPLDSIYDIPEHKKEMDENMYNYMVDERRDVPKRPINYDNTIRPYNGKIAVVNNNGANHETKAKQGGAYDNILLIVIVIIIGILLYRKFK